MNVSRVASRWLRAQERTNPDGAPTSESHFFDAPRKRETREFAESGAISNVPGVAALAGADRDNAAKSPQAEAAAVAEAPPNVTEILKDTPGVDEFSTLSRYVVMTHQPTDAGVPQGNGEIPRHPKVGLWTYMQR